jgi:hypothetical protein
MREEDIIGFLDQLGGKDVQKVTSYLQENPKAYTRLIEHLRDAFSVGAASRCIER